MIAVIKELFFKKWFPNWSPDIALRYMFIVNEIKRDKSIKSILDVGSGSLGITPYLRRKVTGLDINFSGPKTSLLVKVVGSAHNIPFQNDSFDVVVCSDVLEHVPMDKRLQIIREIFRVSKEKIFLTFPTGQKSNREDRYFYQYVKSITGRNDKFIQEHIRYGLPSLKKVLSAIPTTAKISVRGCTNIYLHRLILRLQFSSNKIARFISSVIFVLLIPLFLKINFEPTYRKLIVIKKE